MGRDYADVTVVRGTYRGGLAAELDVTVRSALVGDLPGITLSTDRRRGELVQYQTLGAMRQLQRLGAMSQSLGGMTQTMGPLRSFDGASPASMRDPHGEEGVPRQQPQQQQQGTDRALPEWLAASLVRGDRSARRRGDPRSGRGV